jgi:hypothetical protein
MTKKTKVSSPLTLAGFIFYFLIAAEAGVEKNFLNLQGTTMTAVLKEVPLEDVFAKVQKETGIWPAQRIRRTQNVFSTTHRKP